MFGRSGGYSVLVMTRRPASPHVAAGQASDRRARERGNIVLVAALIVLSMGVTAVVVAKLIQSRLTMDSDLRLSNYAGMLAQYTAEGGINSLLWYWNTLPAVNKVSPPNRPASYPDFPSIVSTYSVPGGGSFYATSTATYSLAITQLVADVPNTTPGQYRVIADATVSSPAAGPGWQTITRRVTVTIASGSQYTVTGYSR